MDIVLIGSSGKGEEMREQTVRIKCCEEIWQAMREWHDAFRSVPGGWQELKVGLESESLSMDCLFRDWRDALRGWRGESCFVDTFLSQV